VRLSWQRQSELDFGGGIVVDYPESKKVWKYYLCFVAGTTNASTFAAPLVLRGEAEKKVDRWKGRKQESRKQFIVRKKELYRKRGKEGVPYDSKYSGRKRRAQF
jgi:18S rRNA (guanine1575-N7)-methyltransferase